MITLIFSKQSKMAQSALSKLIKKDYPKRDECNYVSFDMGVCAYNELADECQMLPLGYEKKAVVGENCALFEKSVSKYKFLKGDGGERILSYLENPDPNIDLYLLVYSDALDLKSPYLQAISKNGTIKEVSQLSPDQWLGYIANFFAKRNAKIDSDAVKELYNRTEGDFASFLNESEKLLAYCNGDPITVAEVALLVSPKLDEDVFHLSNALTSGDVETALHIYQNLKTHSVDEIRLISLLVNQFRYLDEVRFLDAKGLSSSEIAKQLGGSPYRVNIALRSLYKLSESSLLRIMEELYSLDYRILSGKIDASYGFSLFLADFSLA